MMFRCAVFLLFLTLGIVTLCAADLTATTVVPTTQAPTSHATNATTAAPATKATTAEPTTKATTAEPITKATTAETTTKATTAEPATNATTLAPATNATTAAPTTNATTAAPTTNATTAAPTTNATTAEPTTNATTAEPATNTTTADPTTNATTTAPLPTTPPTPTLPTPTTGHYNVSSMNDTCLIVKFGLQIVLKEGEKSLDMNLEPEGTAASGACGANSSDLVLTSDKMTVMFTFTTEAKKFQLHALNITVKSDSGIVFTEANTNLSLWQAALGSSYLCNKQQSFNITSSLTLYTFDLQVQPFEVKKGVFSTAHECSMDDTSILIPIIVGAALAGLILIVVIAYAIGRRKTYVGYQTL